MTDLLTNKYLIPNTWDILSESNNKENIFHGQQIGPYLGWWQLQGKILSWCFLDPGEQEEPVFNGLAFPL